VIPLQSRANAEIEVIKTIKTKYADRTFGIPFIAEKISIVRRTLKKYFDMLKNDEGVTAATQKAGFVFQRQFGG
jgi:hypothetical protein